MRSVLIIWGAARSTLINYNNIKTTERVVNLLQFPRVLEDPNTAVFEHQYFIPERPHFLLCVNISVNVEHQSEDILLLGMTYHQWGAFIEPADIDSRDFETISRTNKPSTIVRLSWSFKIC